MAVDLWQRRALLDGWEPPRSSPQQQEKDRAVNLARLLLKQDAMGAVSLEDARILARQLLRELGIR